MGGALTSSNSGRYEREKIVCTTYSTQATVSLKVVQSRIRSMEFGEGNTLTYIAEDVNSTVQGYLS